MIFIHRVIKKSIILLSINILKGKLFINKTKHIKYNTKNKKLNINDFQHPFNKRAVDAVTKVPGFEKLIEFIASNSIEKAYSLINDSSKMKVTKEMSPKIFEMMSEAAEMFDVNYIPELLFLPIIEKKFNSERYVSAFSDKNLLPFFVIIEPSLTVSSTSHTLFFHLRIWNRQVMKCYGMLLFQNTPE